VAESTVTQTTAASVQNLSGSVADAANTLNSQSQRGNSAAAATIDTSEPKSPVELMETESHSAAGVDSGQQGAQIHATVQGPAIARPEAAATSTDATQRSSLTESPLGEGLRSDTDTVMITG
jgi:hypothetical protein